MGLKDKKLSEQLQLDSKLTLEKAITKSRQSETVKNSKVSYKEILWSSNQLVWIVYPKEREKKSMLKVRIRKRHPNQRTRLRSLQKQDA